MNSKTLNLIKFVLSMNFILLLTLPVLSSTASADENLIANPGFEDGSATPLNWNLVTNAGNTPFWDTVNHSGMRSVRVKISGTSNIISGYPLSDTITAQPSTDYTFSAWVKTEKAGGSTEPMIRIVEYDSNYNFLKQTNIIFSQGTNDWTQKQIDFRTDSDAAYFHVYANIWSGYGTFWVDDIVLTPRNEIASTRTPSPTQTPTPTPTLTLSPDAKPPTVVFSYPVNGQTFTTSAITVSGTASGLSNVEVRVNSGTWVVAPGATTWSKSVTLTSGSNTIYARATDTSGNFKDTSVMVTYNPPAATSSKTISINPDKTLNIDGKKKFPVFMYNICNAHYELSGMVEPCDPSKNSEFLFSGGGEYYQNFGSTNLKNKYEQTGVLFTVVGSGDIPQDLIDSTNFFGYSLIDEPDDDKLDLISSTYDQIKKRDTKHPVILNHWRDMKKWSIYSDIITFDIYPYKDNEYWTREDSLYGYEHITETSFFKGTNINGISQPVWAVLQAYGLNMGNFFELTPKEARANTYTAITMDAKGIGYWGYLSWTDLNPSPGQPYGTGGLYNDITLHNYYRQLGRELTSINDILVLPTKDYSWEYRKGTMVSFSKSLTKDILWRTRSNFNYMLKQDGDKWYLIVVNKDSRTISNVGITINGLSGIKTAKTLGLETSGSGRAGRILSVNNGLFTDSFDGLAVHIYQLS